MTVSVQGHNINVFQIMPILSENTLPTPGSSYVHLYRLQRGLTNAVCGGPVMVTIVGMLIGLCF